jgi:integrase/recombinase XerC
VERVDEFLEHLRLGRRLSEHTLRAYAGDLRRYAAFLRTVGAATPQDAGPAELKRFAADLLGEGLARTGVARRMAAVRTFYKYLLRAGVVDADPSRAVRTPKVRRKLPRALTDAEIARLLAAPADDTFVHARDRAALELLYSAGLRNAELTGLDMDRLDLAGGLCRVMGKGSKERLAVVGSFAKKAFEDYLPYRAAILKPAAGEAVFLNRFGTRLDGRSLRRVLERHLVRADLPDGTTPHTLRHTFATHLLERGAALKEVQELLGHRHLSSTQVYTHLSPEHLRAVYDAAHPRARARGGSASAARA